MPDLPDYYTASLVAWNEIVGIQGGLDADKPAAPAIKDVYVATDTKKLYVCYAAGVWTDVTYACLLLAGGTMTGNIAMGNHKVTGLAAPTNASDAARKAYVDLFTLLTTFNNHSARHENSGADEVSVTGLSGLLADDQHVIDAEAKAAAVQAGAITNGVTKAPTHDAVYDVKATADAALPAGSKYTDAEAVTAMGAKANGNPLHHDRATEWGATEHTAIGDNAPHHVKYTNAEAVDAIEADANLPVAGINFIFDGGGEVLAAGSKGDLRIPFACTINRVTLLSDLVGSVTISILKGTYAEFPLEQADTICEGAQPVLDSERKYEDNTLSGWTTAITAGDILEFYINSAATIKLLSINLKVTKT